MAGVEIGDADKGAGADGTERLHLVDLHAALLRWAVDDVLALFGECLGPVKNDLV